MSHGFHTHKPWPLMSSLWIGLITFIHLSSLWHPTTIIAETGNGSCLTNPDCLQLANTVMVPQAYKTLDWEATPPSKTHKQCPSTIHPRTAGMGSQLHLMACL